MAWNESQNKDKDPWGKPVGPPNLDELLRKYKNKLLAVVRSGKEGEPGTSNSFQLTPLLIGSLLFFILLLWAVSGIFVVSAAERALVLRFGKYHETLGPGLHWIPRLIDSYTPVNIQRIMNYTYQSEMLTKDENIVSAQASVQYRVDDPLKYAFNVVNPDASLEQATASALRQVVGQTTLDEILTTGRGDVRDQIAKQLQDILNIYNSGLVVTNVTLQSVRPPEMVTDAFDDAIKAREDEQTYINKSNAYSNQILSDAKGQTARIMQEANAFKQQVVLEAQANVASYLALLPEYEKAKDVTRQRLYLSAMESVLDKSSKILIDEKAGNSMLYLPLDKLLEKKEKVATTEATPEKSTVSPTVATAPTENEVLSKMFPERPSYPTRGSY